MARRWSVELLVAAPGKSLRSEDLSYILNLRRMDNAAPNIFAGHGMPCPDKKTTTETGSQLRRSCKKV
jgi:hypothetical protein